MGGCRPISAGGTCRVAEGEVRGEAEKEGRGQKIVVRTVHATVVLVQSLSHVQLFVTPWTAACQSSLSFTISLSLFQLMSVELVMPSHHLILCYPLFLPSILPSIRVFSKESALCIRWPKYRSFGFNISASNSVLMTKFPPLASTKRSAENYQ